jgi:adenine C2-methylase RlmN of 23S rRNA A2503 and tRNA A37
LFIAKHRGQNFVNMFLHRPTKNGSCTLLFGCRSHQRCFFCSAVWSGFVRRSRAGSIALQVILAQQHSVRVKLEAANQTCLKAKEATKE